MESNNPTLSRVLNEDLQTEKRQELITEIEDSISDIRSEECRVMCYIAKRSMNADDVKAFEDMLQSVDSPEVLYLFINSPGGDPETALRVIEMCRERSSHFRAVVPDMAKSAATQVCLGTEEIAMGYNSELGPIDPQIPFRGEWTAAYTIKEGLELIETRAKEKPEVPTQVYQAIAQHYDPALLRRAEKAIDYIEDMATEIAGNMFNDDDEATDCVEELLELNPHGKSINIEQAENMGLNIFDLRDHEDLWSKIWELYIRSDTIMDEHGREKLWETKDHTISTGGDG